MTAARPGARMSARRCATPLRKPYTCAWPPSDLLSRPLVKKLVNPPRRFGADAFDLHQVGDRGALDGLERAEVMQQCALARRPDAGNLLQAGLAQVLGTARPVRADGEAMRLVAQPLDKIEHRIARRQLERVAAREEEGFAARVEVAEAAVDQDEIGPGRVFLLFQLRAIASS